MVMMINSDQHFKGTPDQQNPALRNAGKAPGSNDNPPAAAAKGSNQSADGKHSNLTDCMPSFIYLNSQLMCH